MLFRAPKGSGFKTRGGLGLCIDRPPDECGASSSESYLLDQLLRVPVATSRKHANRDQ